MSVRIGDMDAREARTDPQRPVGADPQGKSACERLGELLQEAGVVVKFGLRQQGHLEQVHRWVEAGKSWAFIAKRIGWAPDAVRRDYLSEVRIEAFRAGFVAHPEAEAPRFQWSFDPATCAAGDRWRDAYLAWREVTRD